MRVCLPTTLLLFLNALLHAQTVGITVNTLKNRTPVSLYLYGRNNSLSADPSSPVTTANWQLYKDAGLNFFRENGGNDAHNDHRPHRSGARCILYQDSRRNA
jgi:hypothetical protein